MAQTPFEKSSTGGRSVSTVPLASSYARKLVQHEQRSSGADTKAAIAAVARRLRRPSGSIWSLLFRPPKDVAAGLFLALEAAVESALVRNIKELEDELAAVRKGARRLDPRMVEEAEASLARLKKALGTEAPQ